APIAAGAGTPLISRFRCCDGSQSLYQMSVAGSQAYRATLTDLAVGGGRNDLSGSGAAVGYQVSRPASKLVLAPQSAVITAGGIVDGATVTATPGLARGGV